MHTAQNCVNEKTGYNSTPKSANHSRSGINVRQPSHSCQRDEADRLFVLASQKDGQWAYFDVRRDCVLYLEDVANWNLYPLVDRGVAQYPKQDTSSTLSVLGPGQIYHADSSIAVFDFASFEGLVFKPKYSLDAYHNVCWRYINLEWDARVRRMCQDVKESNGCSCLAEGIFSHTQASCLFVLVKLGWHADAKDGRRYRVEESVWRLG